MVGREPDATAEQKAKGLERSNELSAIVNKFILRRTNALLSAHLPPKACTLTPQLPCLYLLCGVPFHVEYP